MEFNLIEEHFIPCVITNGQSRAFSLRDVLAQAHEIAEIRDNSPLVTAALHRLLLAILHRCFGPKSNAERAAILRAGHFEKKRLDEYLARWRDRFDLFHEKCPFYQAAGFQTKEPSSISRLAQELSRGNNAALFDHTIDNPPPALTPAQAARVVIAEQAYAIGGGKSDTGNTTSAPLVGGVLILARGDTLFQTLCLNLTVYKEDQPVSSLDSDAPVWERQSPRRPDQCSGTPDGYLDYLTWQSRTLRLHPEEEDGQTVVRRVSYAQGRKSTAPLGFFDPMMAYRRDKKDGDRPLRFSEFRELWRDSAALFQFGETGQFKGPTCLETLRSLPGEVLPRAGRYRVSAFGLCTDKAKVNFWRQESLPLPLAYLDQPQLVEQLKRALSMADQVAGKALRAAAWAAAAQRLTANAEQKPDTDRVQAMVKALAPERLYWSRLELPFREFLGQLPGEETHQEDCIRAWFTKKLRTESRQAYEQTFGRHDAGRDLKAFDRVYGVLLSRLRTIQKETRIPDCEQGETP
jgi:CRISPR system Cascade subunit CasA